MLHCSRSSLTTSLATSPTPPTTPLADFVFQFLLAACVGIWNIYSANRMDRFKSAYTKGLQAAAKQREDKSKKQNELSSKMNASLPATADKLPAGSDEVALQLEGSAFKDSEAPKPKPEAEAEERPHWPLRLPPHAQTRPEAVSSTVCSRPQHTAATTAAGDERHHAKTTPNRHHRHH